jgi:hypothetical protein
MAGDDEGPIRVGSGLREFACWSEWVSRRPWRASSTRGEGQPPLMMPQMPEPSR